MTVQRKAAEWRPESRRNKWRGGKKIYTGKRQKKVAHVGILFDNLSTPDPEVKREER